MGQVYSYSSSDSGTGYIKPVIPPSKFDDMFDSKGSARWTRTISNASTAASSQGSFRDVNLFSGSGSKESPDFVEAGAADNVVSIQDEEERQLAIAIARSYEDVDSSDLEFECAINASLYESTNKVFLKSQGVKHSTDEWLDDPHSVSNNSQSGANLQDQVSFVWQNAYGKNPDGGYGLRLVIEEGYRPERSFQMLPTDFATIRRQPSPYFFWIYLLGLV